MLGHVETRQQELLASPQWDKAETALQYTGIPGVGDNSPMRHCACQLPREEHQPLHPIHSVGRSGGKPHDKLGQGASDDDFIPATSTAQATTISHTATQPIL
jgi:hypothetical protein